MEKFALCRGWDQIAYILSYHVDIIDILGGPRRCLHQRGETMNAERIIQVAIPNASDAVMEHVIWGMTPFPCGAITAQSLFKAACRYRRAYIDIEYLLSELQKKNSAGTGLIGQVRWNIYLPVGAPFLIFDNNTFVHGCIQSKIHAVDRLLNHIIHNVNNV